MSRTRDVDEEKLAKRMARAEKKALKCSGVDEGLIQRFWELVTIFPRISDPELEARIERFTLQATPDQYFSMQLAIFSEGSLSMVEDFRVRRALQDLKGQKIGLAVEGVYESTVTLDDLRFRIERGIVEGIPVISVASRQDYADAILRRKDPVKLILGRRIRASHKLKLLRMALPHLDLLRERGLFEKSLSYQPELEDLLDRTMTEMGY